MDPTVFLGAEPAYSSIQICSVHIFWIHLELSNSKIILIPDVASVMTVSHKKPSMFHAVSKTQIRVY